MPKYIDGFLFPLSKEHMAVYKAVSEEVAAIWKEHGALSYQEYTNEGGAVEGCPSFPATLEVQEGEVVVFGWITFSSKKSRDEVFEKVANDSRMQTLVTPIMQSNNPIFDAQRMVYGEFKSLIQVN